MESWIIYSMLMFISSVVMYLISRKLQLDNVDNRLVALIFGPLALPLLVIYNLVIGQNFAISLDKFLLIGIAALLFSYLGFRFSTNATKMAPNAGFSLIIQKSFAPYTALMGILLFGQTITVQGVIGIALVIIFTGVMLTGDRKVGPKQEVDKTQNKWVLYSFISFFLFGSLSITGKYFTSQGIAPNLLAFYNFVFVGIAFTIDYRKALKPENLKILKKSQIWLLFIAGIFVGFFNIFMYSAIKIAPNIGYVNIINASSNVAITLFSAWLFKDTLTIRKTIGVVGVVGGLIMLFV